MARKPVGRNRKVKAVASKAARSHNALGVKDAFTLLSVALGVTSVFFALLGLLVYAGVAIVLAVAADFLDGRVARATNGANEFGKQLDSLADAMSFGFAPVVLALASSSDVLSLAGGVAFACAGVIRLARFNLQTEQGVFFGLPIPIAALLLVAVVLVLPAWVWLASFCIAALMIAPVKLNKF